MRLTALLPLSLALLAAPPLHAEDALPKAIQQLQAKGAVIKGSFDAPDGLRGYAADRLATIHARAVPGASKPKGRSGASAETSARRRGKRLIRQGDQLLKEQSDQA